METIKLEWYRFASFAEARSSFRGKPCIYLQTDPVENILRVGESDDPFERYKGGTAYALDAAGHKSGNLYFFATVSVEPELRKTIEANLIFHLQPAYNNHHKKYPPHKRLRFHHFGDVPSVLASCDG